MRVSFLGIGNLGYPLAENILKAGEQLQVYSRRHNAAATLAAKGATAVSSVQQLADCDVLCTCLPMPADVEMAAIGKHDLYKHMYVGSIHMDFSTIDPSTATKLAAAAAGLGIGYVQCTVSKAVLTPKREEIIFAGGDSRYLDKMLPLLGKIGILKNMRTIEAACAVKLLCNLIGMANLAVLVEGMRIGQLAGMDLHEFVELLGATNAGSYQMKMRGPRIASGDYEPQFGIDLAVKDLRLGCAMAHDFGYNPRMMELTLASLEKAVEHGLGREDVCAMFKV